jgi:hypothetical protein
MLEAASHRGSEHATVSVGRVAVGVADVGAGRQSSVCLEDGAVAAFVGRLDNQAELEAELARRGRPARSATAASVVLAMFTLDGDAAARRLRGEFAAVVGDGQRLRCLRDQLGFRALFHRHDPNGFFVGSEPKQVIAGAGISYQPDRGVVEQIFYGRVEDETATAIDGVRRLPKATLLEASIDGAGAARYWRPEDLLETARPSPDEIQERFDELMDQSAARMVTPSSVVSLSGGIDSPAVAAYAAPRHLLLTGRPLPALSRLYPDHPTVDERTYIELVAAALGLSLTTYVHQSRHLEGLRDWMRLVDGPAPAWAGSDVEAHLREARRLDADTVLGGELAEFVVDAGEHLDGYLLAHLRLSALARRIRARRAAGQSMGVVAHRALVPFLPRRVAAALTRRGVMVRTRHLPDWVDPSQIDPVPGHMHHRAGERWRWNQLRAFDGAGLSVEAEEVRQDVLGVRMRMPWADIDLWEFFLSLPAEVKYPGLPHKAQVRGLLRGRVPDGILDRSDKTVFNDAIMADIDYPALRACLVDRADELTGVDYARLEVALRREELDIAGFVWARDLCVAHAFLANWSDGPGDRSGSTGELTA